MTTRNASLRLAGYQLRSVERPVLLLVLIFVMGPWFALIAAVNGVLWKLGSLFFLHLLIMALLANDRRIYRTLGLNRLGAIRQQLVLSIPVLVVAGVVTLPGLSVSSWIWVPVVAAVALSVDAAITLSSITVDRRGLGVATGDLSVMGPAKNGGMARRLLVVPMLRWAAPTGIALGLVLGLGGPDGESLLWYMLLAFSLLGVLIAPAVEVQTGTASLATWQSLGLPRRIWSRVVTPVAVLAPILGLLVMLAVLAVLALWGVVTWDIFYRVVAAGPGLVVLLAGLSLWAVSVSGTGGVFGAGAIGATGPLIMMPSSNLLENPTQSNLIVAAVAGGVFFLIGLYIQHRLVNAVSGARVTPDTRQFADR